MSASNALLAAPAAPAGHDSARRADVAFAAAFGGPPPRRVRAPGRVNLIGEHTDYNGGHVLPCAIDFGTVAAAGPRPDRRVRVLAADLRGEIDTFDLDGPLPRSAASPWADYVRGMVLAMREDGLALQGADLVIAGDVPRGAGLSSSASLTVAIGLALWPRGQGAAPDPLRLARLAQRAENRFVGVQCGIMDPLASACAQAGHALLVDCGSLARRQVRLPDDVALMIIHSGVRRGLMDSAYNERRQQCEAAARHFGVPLLCALDEPTLAAGAAGLDARTLRRARHVVSDSRRALQAADALAAADLRRVGQLMAESHVSMRDDFEITTPEVDRLVALAQQAIGPDGGARMTGGGFGGCVVALMPQAQVPEVRQALMRDYRTPEGRPPELWLTGAAAGAGDLGG